MSFDLGQLTQMLGQLRAQLQAKQEQAARLRYTGEAGAGLVRVVVNGRSEVLEVKVDPKCLDPKEPALLEDLLRAAVNQAMAKAAAGMQQDLGSMVSGLGLDLPSLGDFFGPKK